VPLGQLEGAKALPSNKTLPAGADVRHRARAPARAAALLRKAGYEKAVAVAGGNGRLARGAICRWKNRPDAGGPPCACKACGHCRDNRSP
jgi:hypothetical protein